MPNLAFLSTAHIHTKSFIENVLSAADGRRIVAVWDDQATRGRHYAQMAGAPFVADLAAVLADEAVDGFVICAENTRHLDLLAAALPVGKPVFCEKPLVTTRADLAPLQALVATHATPLLAGYFKPFAAEMRTIAGLIAEGAFGPITRVRYRNAHHAAYGRWFDAPELAWFHDPALSGGGAFMDMGTHALHLLGTLLGAADEVWAHVANHSGEYPACDDYGIAHLRLPGGVLGTVEAAWTQTGGLGGLEIVGAKQSLWQTPDGYVMGAPRETPVRLEVTAVAAPTRMDRLVAVIRGEIAAAELQRDLTNCLETVAVMAAAYESAASGQWTKVGLSG